ncbi:insulin-like growth factor-binding protein 7 [Carassius gibelio]|uniref:insulin-like growth factor-binding protein 7 n=1 Tax=Carassius gibelio TaxID=101364 RepID=UPI0022794F6C|nr:insulin-like growth factor-binding protein 7 [Carassius gibelio]
MICWLLLTLFAVVSADRLPRSCGTCDPSKCAPLPAEGCSSETLLDACGCCKLCASGVGEPCGGAKRCASGLECVKSDKDKKSQSGTWVCECKSNYPVCGTDGVNYKSGCELKEASVKAVKEKKPEIKIQNKGECAQAPVIVTAPGEIWNVTGSRVFLSCEATGIPTPVLTWRKVSINKENTVPLPGDKENLAVQTRGGPEKHEATGWVLISPLTKDEDGSYECHASNIQGEASAVGTIHVVDSINDIPHKKGKDAEL